MALRRPASLGTKLKLDGSTVPLRLLGEGPARSTQRWLPVERPATMASGRWYARCHAHSLCSSWILTGPIQIEHGLRSESVTHIRTGRGAAVLVADVLGHLRLLPQLLGKLLLVYDLTGHVGRLGRVRPSPLGLDRALQHRS